MIPAVSLMRLIAVLLTGGAVAAGYLQESRRLQVIRRLSGDKARAYYESGRARGEGAMWAITIALAVAAAVTTLRGLPFLGAGSGL